jgi:hypothetical protein
MKRDLFCFVIFMLSVGVLSAQEYKKVKVTLNDGIVFKGTNGVITDESFSCQVSNTLKTYSLDEIKLVQAKEGKAGKWALGFGGGCAGIVIITGLVSGSEGIEAAGGTTGMYIAGGIIWTGIFAGIGALIGNSADDYENVYLGKTASLLKNFDLNLTSNQYAKYNLTLSYTIPIH